MKGTFTFTDCIQDSQDYGSDDEHMVSRVFFDLDLDGHQYPRLHVDVKQVVGSRFDTGDNIEVGTPKGYSGPFNYTPFREAVERFFRELAGASGSKLGFGPGVKNLRMRNNHLRPLVPKVVVIDIDGSSTAEWMGSRRSARTGREGPAGAVVDDDYALAVNQLSRLESFAQVGSSLPDPPVSMPADRLRAAGVDPDLWYGLGIVGVWATIDAFVDRKKGRRDRRNSLPQTGFGRNWTT